MTEIILLKLLCKFKYIIIYYFILPTVILYYSDVVCQRKLIVQA
jgi:hypothetical protein